ncbi:MAG: endosialidase [Lachnospiraceae bacterium]|nr:endosialidase [Lachnospiraceae bacterium]
MAVVSELIRSESDGTISFGDYTKTEKSKLDDFKHAGDVYKVKTFKEITKLERNGMFVYESVPGTSVEHLEVTDEKLAFLVEGCEDANITLELEPETEYDITVNHNDAGKMKTNLGGKLSLSVELEVGSSVPVVVKKA